VKPQLEELSIEVTNECPLACIHCSSGSSPKRLPDELSVDRQMELIQEARDMGATVLSLSGGEPLVYPHTMRLIEEANRLDYKRILLYTTGHTHSTGLVFECDWVSSMYPEVTWIFSLHSPDAVVNDNIMGRDGVTVHILESIRYLTQCGANVEVHMVPMKPNFEHIDHMRHLCDVLKVSRLSLLRFVPQTRGYANRDELLMSKAEFAEMQAIIHFQSQCTTSDVELRLGCPIDFRHTLGLTPRKVKPCHAGDDLILVRPNGDAHPCAAWKSLPSDINVKNASLAEVFYESKVFQAIRRFKQDGGWAEIESCNQCKYALSCMGGCPAQRLHAYGKTLDALYTAPGDPMCHMVADRLSPMPMEEMSVYEYKKLIHGDWSDASEQ